MIEKTTQGKWNLKQSDSKIAGKDGQNEICWSKISYFTAFRESIHMLFYDQISHKGHEALSDCHPGEWSWSIFEWMQNMQAMFELWQLFCSSLKTVYHITFVQSATFSWAPMRYWTVKDHHIVGFKENLTSIVSQLNWSSIFLKPHNVIWLCCMGDYN